MQRLRTLTNQLKNETDPEEIERIQDEIWEIEEAMNTYDDMEYKSNHSPKDFS